MRPLDKEPIRRDGYRYRICSDCERTFNISIRDPNEKKYICPHCEYKKRRPGMAVPKAARKQQLPIV